MVVKIPAQVARARTASIHRDENQRAEEKATAQCDQRNEKRQGGSSLSTPQSTPKYESEDRLDILQNTNRMKWRASGICWIRVNRKDY